VLAAWTDTVIDFGRKAGERGPDVISVDRNGEVQSQERLAALRLTTDDPDGLLAP